MNSIQSPICLKKPLLGLGNGFPSRVWISRHDPSGKYGCYIFDGIHGLSCFSSQEKAEEHRIYCAFPEMSHQEVSFDDARETAKERGGEIECLMLLDDILNPVFHYIK